MTLKPAPQIMSLQAGRGIASLFVVALHAVGYINGTRYWNRPDLFHMTRGGHLGVEYFFVLSGAVIMMAHQKEIGHTERIPAFLWKRFRRIYPIYWVILTVVVLEYLLRPGMGEAFQRDPLVLLSGYLLVYLGTLQMNLPVAWTLFLEVLFYTLFLSLFVGRRLGICVLSIWAVCCASQLFWPGPPWVSLYMFAPRNLLFLFGILVGMRIRRNRYRHPAVLALCGSLLFVSAYIWCCLPLPQPDFVELVAGAGAALLILGAAGMEHRGQLSIPKWLRFLGAASYSIYLVHFPFLMFFTPILFKLWNHEHIPLSLVLLIQIGAATALGCALHILVERPLLEWRNDRTAIPVSVKA